MIKTDGKREAKSGRPERTKLYPVSNTITGMTNMSPQRPHNENSKRE
jgi:hypothetical protein